MTDRIWTPASLWKAALGELELQMTKATFDTWLRGTVAVALDETTITIHCKSTFARFHALPECQSGFAEH